MDLPQLPSDVIEFQILTRMPFEMPFEAIKRCRLVCKRLNEATYESYFIQLNQRAGIVSGVFVQSFQSRRNTYVCMDDSQLSLKFLPHQDSMKIEAVNKEVGLLLCDSYRGPKYTICKPSTQQWVNIPNPKTRFSTCKTALVVLKYSSPDLHYKVVRFSESIRCLKGRPPRYHTLQCEIFYSKSWSWKCLPENQVIKLPFGENLDDKPTILVSGFLFSFTTKKRIFALELEKETWEVFELPPPLCDNDYCELDNMHLVEYQGRLALIFLATKEECMDIWVVEDCVYKKTSWSMIKKLDLKTLRREHDGDISYGAIPSSDVTVMKGSDQLTFYYFRSHTFEEVKVENQKLNQIFIIESDDKVVNLKFNNEEDLQPFKSQVNYSQLCEADQSLSS